MAINIPYTFVAGTTANPTEVNQNFSEVANKAPDKSGVENVTGTWSFAEKVTTSKGLVFPATQVASTGANDLDDYEEGDWTPVIGGSGGTSGQSYSVQVGRYVKVGQLVMATYNVQLSTEGTITGNAQIQGLPFTSLNVANANSAHAVVWQNLATTWTSVVANLAPNATSATLQGTTAAAGTVSTLTAADIADTTNFIGVIVYRANA